MSFLIANWLYWDTPKSEQSLGKTPPIRTFKTYDKEDMRIMPKMKTKRGAAKRFKLTASGKIKRNKAYHSHELSKLASGKSNDMAKTTLVSKADTKAVLRLLGLK